VPDVAGLLRPESTFVALHPDVVRQIGSTAANVLGYIAYVESDQGAPLTAQQISTGTGVSVSTVKRLTARLRQQGVLGAERASSWDATLIYRVDWSHPVIAGQPESVTLAPSRVSECADGGDQDGTLLLSEQKELPTPPVVPPPAPAADAATYDEPLLPMLPVLTVVPDPKPDPLAAEFAAFWGHYPRKVGKAKAEQAFRRARRTTALEPIAAGLMAQLPDLQAAETRYVPHATTWLNGERWADVPEHAVNRAPSRDVFGNPDTVRGAEELLAGWQTPALGGPR
jgi:hypothetical protein